MISNYDIIMRTLMDLPDNLLHDLDNVSMREGISRAEAVRRAVSAYVTERNVPRHDAAFGIWKNKNLNPLDHEDLLRDGWRR